MTSPAFADVELKSGSRIKGETRWPTTLRGRIPQGVLELSWGDVRTLAVIDASCKADVQKFGRPATVELRDGSALNFSDLAMYRVVISRYVNVDATRHTDPTIWIRVKRGVATVKMEVGFEKIAKIVFDAPRATANSYEPGDKLMLTLADGTTLAGACGGEGDREACRMLLGVSDDQRLLHLYGNGHDLGWLVRSITFRATD